MNIYIYIYVCVSNIYIYIYIRKCLHVHVYLYTYRGAAESAGVLVEGARRDGQRPHPTQTLSRQPFLPPTNSPSLPP